MFQHKHTSRLWALMSLLAVGAIMALFAAPAHGAQVSEEASEAPASIRVIRPVKAGETSAPLRVLAQRPPAGPPTAGMMTFWQQVNQVLPKALKSAGQSGTTDPAVVQSSAPVDVKAMPTPLTSFDGTDNQAGVLPPDTNGDIGYNPGDGTKYYFQAVNLQFSIWDVTDPTNPTLLVDAAPNNSLWSGFGGICENNNDGDPIVLFDHLAQRWIFSQFALDFGTPEFHQCIAVSQTADPTGNWYLYDYFISDTNMNDYPKFGVWPDAYYMTVNQFDATNSFSWAGAGVAAFERDAMLNGDPNAAMVYIDVGAVTLDYGGMLPADLDGAAPPAGTPGYFIEWDDSSWLGDAADTLRIWEFHVDWNNPSNSTFGANANYDANFTVTTADVDPDMCGFARNCIPQPGGTNLDSISDRLMYRAAFRVLPDGSFTLLSNHTVDADGSDHAGVHWFELRYDGTNWSMYQEGVYAPDSEHRWMGSIAMDQTGNIALGFSLSSTSTYPSVVYAGRLSSDPLGQMSQGEEILVAGGGSQSHSSGRWGDYSMMAVDPQDDCTFWYTQEYYSADGSASWNTRIGAFKFPSCTAGPTGSLEGTVTDANTSDPIEHAKVTVSDGTNTYETYTDPQGYYAFASLPVGTYDVTAEAWGYNAETVTGVTVSDGATTQQDFALTPMPMTTITFEVYDALTSWPLYARISIDGTPYTALYTDPETGMATAQMPAGTYDVTVTSMWPGYVDDTHTLTVTATDATDTVLMNADLAACEAPGYGMVGFFEDFETGVPPAGWTVVDNISGGGLTWNTNTFYGDGNYTGGAGIAADVNSDNNRGVPYDTELVTPVLNVADLPSLVLTFLVNYQNYSGSEYLDVDISTDGGTTWTNILHWNDDHGNLYSTPGEKVSVDLTSYVGTAASFQLRWHYYSPDTAPWDWYAQIDEVAIGDCVPVADGLVFGAVMDANSGDYFSGSVATVSDGTTTALWISAAQDSATPPYLYVIAEPAGDVTLTASGPLGYQDDTATVTVVAAAAVRHDFNLTAPHLTLSPDQQDFVVYPANPTTTGSATLSNIGSADAPYTIFAVKGPVPSYSPLSEEALERMFEMEDMSKAELSALFDLDAQNAGSFAMPTGEQAPVTMANAGDVVASWTPTGLTYAWGLGVERASGNVWVGDLAAVGAPSNTDYEFLPDGTATGNAIDLPWVGVFAADMAYNPFTGTLWQINVGGDYCIYELDPVSLTSTGRKVCPEPALSLRGLAFDPLTNTFIAGTWNYGGYVFRISMEGEYYEMKQVNLPISGLAFNPGTGHLFALINTDSTAGSGAFDVYVLDPAQDYAIIGAFNVGGSTTVMDANGQAGLGVSCDGTLWAVDQSATMVYGFESGETGWCDFTADWLTVTPETGTAAAGGDVALTLNIDMTGLPTGSYDAHLQAAAYTPYADPMSGVHVDLLANNDAIEGAVALDIPSSTLADTSTYTFRSDDPVPSCTGARTGATAWYTVTAATDRYVGVDTFLSDFDTVVGIYSGSPGALTEVACSDDAGTGAQSHVTFQATAGTTYYIMVGAKNEGTGGTLHLHVSSFVDVPGNLWAWPYIEALRQSGITEGYPDGTYKPNNHVTRAQMAKFMLLAKHGAGYTPPSFSSYSFTDIAGTWAADWIEQAYQEGIVGGYGDGTYRPNNVVTRAQMVKFILLAKHGAGYTPPSFSSYSFTDIAGIWAADWIEEAYQEGIVGGYGDGTYRPNNPVTRAQMAKFIVNAFSLTMPNLTP